MIALLGVLLAAGATALICWPVLVLARRWQIMDVPNARSAHQQPTPRGGGISFVLVALAVLVVATANGWAAAVLGWCLILGGIAFAGLGLWDDLHDLPASGRLLAHLLGLMAVVVVMQSAQVITALSWWQLPLLVLGLAWLLNLTNFMDGIDGLATTEAVVVFGSLALLFWWCGDNAMALLAALLAGAFAGFLPCNWQPARLFMGDAGSNFLGFLFAAMVLLSPQRLGSVWPPLILLAVFIADTSVTLAHRAWRGERLHQAHQGHAYQILARYWGSHQRVVLALCAINLVWLLPLAWLACLNPQAAPLLAAVAYCPLLAWVGWQRRWA